MSDDLDAVARAASAAHDRFGDHVTAARSQPYYLDITHPEANKGAVALGVWASRGSAGSGRTPGTGPGSCAA